MLPPATAIRSLVRFVTGCSRSGPAADDLPRHLVIGHGLAPLAYKAGYVQFRTPYIESALASDLRAKLLSEVGGALLAAGCDVCLLKGISYCETLYDEPAERVMGDIDLLVPTADFELATRTLCDIGFLPRQKRVQHAPGHHALTLDRGRATVDLHRSMVPKHRSRLDMSAVWSRTEILQGPRKGLRRMETTDELLLHLIHIARHELLVPASAYLDAHRLLTVAGARRGDVIARARQTRTERGVVAALSMLGELLMAPAAGPSIRIPSVRTTANQVALLATPRRFRRILTKASLVQGAPGAGRAAGRGDRGASLALGTGSHNARRFRIELSSSMNAWGNPDHYSLRRLPIGITRS